MKKIVLFGAMMLSGVFQNVNAQNDNYEYNITKIASIIDKASFIGDFSEGYLNVCINGKWGYINFRGEIVSPFEYNNAKPFSSGMAKVEKEGQSGFVNVNGQFVTNEHLKGANDFYDGLAVTFNGQYGIVNKQGRLVVPYQPNIIEDYKDGMALVYVDRRKYGAYNTNGQLVVPAIYDGMRSFNSGLACAQIGSDRFYVRKNGARLQPSGLIYGNDFKDNMATIETSDGRGFMDSNGRITVFQSLSGWGESYCEFEDFSEGIAVVHDCAFEGEPKKGYMNKFGKIVVPTEYNEAYPFKNGMGKVAKKGRYGFVNTDGRLVVNCIYEDATDYNDGFGIVKQNGKYGYINKQGNLIGQIVFDEAKPFAFGIAKVKRNGKVGFIDKNGQCTLDCKESYPDSVPLRSETTVSISEQPEIRKAVFVGGETAMRSFLISNLKYPAVAAEEGEQGSVIVGFTVEEDGSLTDINIKKSVSPSIDREAKRLISIMPKWQPAQSGGQNVKSTQTVKINFIL